MTTRNPTRRKTPTRPVALLVAGMHRSGTSALTRVLAYCGFALPQTLMEPGSDNPKGFWESRLIADLNDEMLKLAGSEWADDLVFNSIARATMLDKCFGDRARSLIGSEVRAGRSIVLKDPRISLFLDFWLRQLETLNYDCRVIIPIRDPVEVAESLYTRQKLSTRTSQLLWLSYLLAAERSSRAHPRSLIRYSDLLSDWRSALAQVEVNIGVPLMPAPNLAGEIDGFLDPTERHHQSKPADIRTWDAPPWIERAFQMFSDACEEGRFPYAADVDDIATDLGIAEATFAPVIAALRAELSEKARDQQALQESLRHASDLSRNNQTKLFIAQQKIDELWLQRLVASSALSSEQQRTAALDQRLADVVEQRVATAGELGRQAQRADMLESQLAIREKLLTKRQDECAMLRDQLTQEHQAKALLQQSCLTLEATVADLASRSEALARDVAAGRALHRLLADKAADRAARLSKAESMQSDTLAQLEAAEETIERRERQFKQAFEQLGEQVTQLRNRSPLQARLRRWLWSGTRFRPIGDWLQAMGRGSVWNRSIADVQMLRSSNLFDRDFYLAQAVAADVSGADPAWHYLATGWRSGLDPSVHFSTQLYLDANPDVMLANQNPLVHYLRHGRAEGRQASPSRLSDVRPFMVAPSGAEYTRLPQLRRRARRFIERYGLGRADCDIDGAFLALASSRADAVPEWAGVRVSVIILPVDDPAAMLPVLDSVVRQDMGDQIEILLPNSGGSLFSAEGAAKVAGLKTVGLPGGPLIENLEEAWRKARGELIFLMPAVNLLDPSCVAALVDAISIPAGVDCVLPAITPSAEGDAGHPRHAYRVNTLDWQMVLFRRGNPNASDILSQAARLFAEIPQDSENEDVFGRLNALRIWRQPWARWIPLGDTGDDDRAWRSEGTVRSTSAIVVDARFPNPDRDAGSRATHDLILALQANGLDASFAALQERYRPELAEGLERIGVEVIDLGAGGLGEWLADHGAELRLAVAIRVDVAMEVVPIFRERAPNCRIIFHAADLHFLREQRQATVEGNAALLAKAEMTRAKEIEVARQVEVTLVHSEYELAQLRAMLPDAKTVMLPFMLRPEQRINVFERRRDVVFIGGFGHPPNADAVLHFVETIWPIIRAQRSDILFKIAGSDIPANIRALDGRDGIRVVGFVRDLRDLFGSVRLSIAPLRYGAGAKGKVAISLAHGVPAILSPIAAEGMGLDDGEGVLIRDDDPQSWSDAILSVYDDKAAWHGLSMSALQFVEEQYAPEKVEQIVRSVLLTAGVQTGGA